MDLGVIEVQNSSAIVCPSEVPSLTTVCHFLGDGEGGGELNNCGDSIFESGHMQTECLKELRSDLQYPSPTP
jgi:hypothetical protein